MAPPPPPSTSIIRWKFVIPTGIFAGALTIFFIFFFDPILTRVLEAAGSKVNGAMVNISDLKTSFSKGRLEVARIQITNKKEPMKNSVDLGPLVFQVNLSDLFTKRVVIPEASVQGIQFNTQRKTSGALPKLAAALEKKEEKEPSAAKKLANKYKDKFVLKLDGLKADIRSKVDIDPKELLITKQANELKERGENVPDKWKQKLERVDVDNRLKQVEQDLKSVRETPTKGAEALVAIPKSLKKLNKAKDELKNLKSDVKNLKNSFSNEVKSLKNGIKGLDGAKKKDLDALMSKMNLDFADPQRLMEGLVGGAIVSRVETILRYVQLARKNLPSKKEKETLPKRVRAGGMNIEFPTPVAPPRLWLKKADLAGVFSGIVANGNLSNVTSDPPRVGEPTILTMEGKKESQKVNLKITLDHVGDTKKDAIQLNVTGVPLSQYASGGVLAQSLKTGEAKASLDFKADGENDIRGQLKLGLSSLAFDDATLLDIAGISTGPMFSLQEAFKAKFMKTVARKIEEQDEIAIVTDISGTWDGPSMKISSNFTKILGEVIKSALGDAVKNQRQQLEAQLNEILTGKKSEVNSVIAKLQNDLSGKIGGLDSDIQKKINDAAGINLTPAKDGSSPLKGIKIPSSIGDLFK